MLTCEHVSDTPTKVVWKYVKVDILEKHRLSHRPWTVCKKVFCMQAEECCKKSVAGELDIIDECGGGAKRWFSGERYQTRRRQETLSAPGSLSLKTTWALLPWHANFFMELPQLWYCFVPGVWFCANEYGEKSPEIFALHIKWPVPILL